MIERYQIEEMKERCVGERRLPGERERAHPPHKERERARSLSVERERSEEETQQTKKKRQEGLERGYRGRRGDTSGVSVERGRVRRKELVREGGA